MHAQSDKYAHTMGMSILLQDCLPFNERPQQSIHYTASLLLNSVETDQTIPFHQLSPTN